MYYVCLDLLNTGWPHKKGDVQKKVDFHNFKINFNKNPTEIGAFEDLFFRRNILTMSWNFSQIQNQY